MMIERTQQAPAASSQAERPIEPGGADRQLDRHYFLRLWIGKALYQKLVRAHGQLRLPDGSRPELSELLDMAVEALLAETAQSRARDTTSAEGLTGILSDESGGECSSIPDSEPSTVRVPTTMRWCLDAKR